MGIATLKFIAYDQGEEKSGQRNRKGAEHDQIEE